jgi:putative endonuclease
MPDDTKFWVTYLLLCADGSYYCGVTNNLERRLAAHNDGTASRLTRTKLPVRLEAVSGPLTKQQSMSLEWHVKRLPRGEKVKAVREAGRENRLSP